jgi:hypothetical protein
MSRTRTRFLRLFLTWTAAAVLVLSVAAWVASLWGVAWGWSTGVTGVYRGAFVLRVLPDPPPYPNGWFVQGFTWEQFWWPWRLWSPGLMVVPLWIPVAFSAVGLSRGLVLERRPRKLAMLGHCRACGYDLTGITGPCPECGSERR